ncbi:radical SAM protein [Brachyspira intermedia]|uniref:radical SAM protein n=1 Tax=Brachyspira intermedia TaxID=84377 RepID=UPI0030073832
MKWINKGHEFDELGKIFEKNKDLLFLGNVEKAKSMKQKLSFLGANIYIPEKTYIHKNNIIFGFIKDHLIKQHIKSSNTNLNNKTIIITGDYSNTIEQYLTKIGLKKNINYFISNNDQITFYDYQSEFTMKYLSIFSVYAYDKVYLPSNNIVTTSVCNLNCEACLNFNPYNKNKYHNNIDNLKRDIDIYFSNVDMVALLHVTGGEPTLYPQLSDFLKYINNNYRNKIIDLVMPTNGIREITDELCQTFNECNMVIQVDNYLDAVPKYKNIYENNIEKLIKYNVKTDIIPAGERWNWVRAYPPKYDYSKLSDEENTSRFDMCGSYFSEIRNGRIYSCCYNGFAETANIADKLDDGDTFDLEKNSNKKALVEFRLKYNEKGFTSFCKKCNGLPPLNSEYIKPAEQVIGTISWNGEFDK